MVFEYDDSGYVKDDDKDELDADAMLASIREGTEQANVERKRCECRGHASIVMLSEALQRNALGLDYADDPRFFASLRMTAPRKL